MANANLNHLQAEKLREQDHHDQALELYNQAIEEYQQQHNFAQLVEAWQGKCLTYKHLFWLRHDLNFAKLAENAATTSLKIAQDHQLQNKFYRCYFRLGEVAMLFENFEQAIDYYQQALTNFPQENAEKGDFQYHLGEAQYRADQKDLGKENLIAGIKLIEKYENQTDSFLIHVWKSGGYLKLAHLLWQDAPIETKNYLKIAEEIILGDERLVIRRRQLGEVKQELNQLKVESQNQLQ